MQLNRKTLAFYKPQRFSGTKHKLLIKRITVNLFQETACLEPKEVPLRES